METPHRTIYKYELELTDLQTLNLPEFSKVLTVQTQGEKVCLWAEVDIGVTMFKGFNKVEIKMCGTGKVLEDYRTSHTRFFKYLSTVQLKGGALVLHVYILENTK